jgi:chromosome segregation ATPase
MTDQSVYVTRQEFEARMSALESETEGEKTVTRHILTETRQNSGDLATIKAQITHLAGDMILANAALNNHGTRLNVLTQDVREIRAKLDSEIRTRLDSMDARLDSMDAKLDSMDAKLDTVLAAVRVLTPRNPLD